MGNRDKKYLKPLCGTVFIYPVDPFQSEREIVIAPAERMPTRAQESRRSIGFEADLFTADLLSNT